MPAVFGWLFLNPVTRVPSCPNLYVPKSVSAILQGRFAGGVPVGGNPLDGM